MPYETITYEKNQNTAVLTFTTPEALNAITEQRLDELDHALDEIRERFALVCILTCLREPSKILTISNT